MSEYPANQNQIPFCYLLRNLKPYNLCKYTNNNLLIYLVYAELYVISMFTEDQPTESKIIILYLIYYVIRIYLK